LTAQQIASQVISWLRTAVALLILASIAAELARVLGIQIPLRSPGHIELAYLAGAYWLTK
jgi:hypothetical protein